MKQRRVGNSLDSHKLEYEEMEFKNVGKVKETAKLKPKPAVKTTSVSAVKRKKVGLKTRVGSKLQPVRRKLHSVVNFMKNPPYPKKKSKKTTKLAHKLAKEQRLRGILGIGLLFVVVSIIYSTYVVRTFVDSTASLVALAPQVIFAVCILVKAFSKIYK